MKIKKIASLFLSLLMLFSLTFGSVGSVVSYAASEPTVTLYGPNGQMQNGDTIAKGQSLRAVVVMPALEHLSENYDSVRLTFTADRGDSSITLSWRNTYYGNRDSSSVSSRTFRMDYDISDYMVNAKYTLTNISANTDYTWNGSKEYSKNKKSLSSDIYFYTTGCKDVPKVDASALSYSLNNTKYYYTGETVTPFVSVKYNGRDVDSSHYTIVYDNNPNAGLHYVTVNFNGDAYTGTASLPYYIIPVVNCKYKDICIGTSEQLSVKGNSSSYTYKSSNTKIATVSSTGKVKGKSKGKVTITVNGDGAEQTITLNIKNPSIKYKEEYVTVSKGKTYKLKPTVLPRKGKITYKSSNKKIATVSSKGTVKGIKRGTAKITASVKYKGKTYKKSIKIYVASSKDKKLNGSAQFGYNTTPQKIIIVEFYNDSMYPVKIAPSAPATAYEGGRMFNVTLLDKSLSKTAQPVIVKPKQKAKLVFSSDYEHYFSSGCEVNLICTYRGKANIYSVHGYKF